jgi:hypothetical protein
VIVPSTLPACCSFSAIWRADNDANWKAVDLIRRILRTRIEQNEVHCARTAENSGFWKLTKVEDRTQSYQGELSMQLSTIQKFGGVSIILGSVLLLAYSILFPSLLPLDAVNTDYSLLVLNPNWLWISIVVFVGILLMVFGFAAVYSRIYAESGWIGLSGFVIVELAYIFQACKVSWEIFLWPVITTNQASLFLLKDFVIRNSPLVLLFRWIANITILVGVVLFCLALIRSKNFPKLGGILIFAGAFLYGLGPVLSVVAAMTGVFILSVGCTIVGLKLIKA